MNKIGILSFIDKSNKLEVLYPDYIIDHNFASYQFDIKHKRNRMISFCAIQVGVSFFGTLYLLFRRSIIYLFINLLSLFLSFLGLYGSLLFKGNYLLIHCALTISVFGTLFVYEILYFLFAENPSVDSNNNRLNDSFMLLLLTIPYVYDVFVGIYNFNMLKRIAEYNDKQIKLQSIELDILNETVSHKEIRDHIENTDKNLCIVCVENQRDTVLLPCGHIIACFDCLKKLFNMSAIIQPSCPICRAKCYRYNRVYQC